MLKTKSENTHLQECDEFGCTELLRHTWAVTVRMKDREAAEYGSSIEHYEIGSYMRGADSALIRGVGASSVCASQISCDRWRVNRNILTITDIFLD
jgi:hypothetical protein